MALSMRSYANRRALNKEVQYNNRLTTFTNPPIQTGDLYVIQDLTVGRNTSIHNLDISGNLSVHGYSSQVDFSGNLTVLGDTELEGVTVNQNLFCYGSIQAVQFLPGQVVNVMMLSNIDLGQNDINVTTSNRTVNIFTYYYTPKIANSYLIVEYQTVYSLNGSGTDEAYGYLKVDSGRISQTYQKWISAAGGGTRSGTMFPIVGRYTNTNTNAKPIAVDVYNATDTDTVLVKGDISTWLKITEIGR